MKIEDYREFEITLNTDTGKFSAYSDYHDVEFDKTTLKAMRKGVDDFINDNVNFRPFKIQKLKSYSGTNADTLGEILTIIGIRKDKRLVIDDNGKKKQLDSYYIDTYGMLLSEYDKLKEQLDTLEKRKANFMEEYHETQKSIFKDVIIVPLQEKLDELIKERGL